MASVHDDPAPAARDRPRTGRAANVALALASLAFGGLLLEVGVRVYAWSIGRGFWENPLHFISPFFTSDGWPAPYRDGDVLVFKEGERVPREKPPGEIRVVCLGGSTTLPGVDAEGVSYPRALEGLLQGRFPGASIHVLNAGENAFSTAHSLVNFALRVLDAQPDIVTEYEAINDLSVNFFGTQTESDYANKYLTPYFLAFRHRTGLVAALGHVSRLVRILDNRLELFRAGGPGYDEHRDWRPPLPYFRRNLRSMVAVARTHGVGIVLGTQAARSTRRTTEGFDAYLKATREVAAELGVPLADVAGVVTGDELFVDDVHTTSEGARAVARAWLDPVAQLVSERLHRRDAVATPPG